MKETKKILFRLILLLLSFINLQAQQNVVSSGNNLVDPSGSVSFSIGQIDYVTQTGTTGTVAQGVQQPFEIAILSGHEFQNITANLVVYPNPTVSIITLSITELNIDNLNYQLFDVTGKKIKSNTIKTNETTINMESLPSATYILKVATLSKELKTFKIIKN